MQKSWLLACLANFMVAATMGLLLRFSKVFPIGVEYAYLLHAHSHTALLGWAYMMCFGLIVQYFVPTDRRKGYPRLFWITQAVVIGMMLSFPVQGYGAVSITFSTLHILCAYIFGAKVYHDTRSTSDRPKLLYLALFFMAFSTLGAWSLGPIGAMMGKESSWYRTAIQFFLHFQFNGWLLMVAVAILLARLKVQMMHMRVLWALSIVLTLGLPLSWNFESPVFFHLNWIGSVLQAFVLAHVGKIVMRGVRDERLDADGKWLLAMVLVSLFLRVALQVMTAISAVSEASHTIRDFAVGFIHLNMLGVVSGLLLFSIPRSILVKNFLWKRGIQIFCVGFMITEVILFARGIRDWLRFPAVWPEEEILFGASLLLPVALLVMLLQAAKLRAV